MIDLDKFCTAIKKEKKNLILIVYFQKNIYGHQPFILCLEMKSKNLIYMEDQEIAILTAEESLETICQK